MSRSIDLDIWRAPRTPFGPFGLRNTFTLSLEAQLSFLSRRQFRLHQQFTEDLILRLGLAYELKGHEGCVNCLSWNDDGSLLASGSDDCHVRIWHVQGKCKHIIATGHTGNIFGIKFLPGSSDNLVASCAADATVRVHDLNAGETRHVFTCHIHRAKKIATAPDSPFVFWSAGEDGLVIQYDLREPRRCDARSCRNVLINLSPYVPSPELKSIACNPVRTELLAVGATDCYTRLYDRRKLSLTSITYPNDMLEENRGFIRRHTWLSTESKNFENFVLPKGCVRYFAPGHLPTEQKPQKTNWKTFSVTDVRFSADGASFLSNIGGEQIYLFEINSENKISKKFSVDENSFLRKKNVSELTGSAKKLKETANEFYHKKSFINAVETYDRAIQFCPQASVLYANRSIALMNRNWDGDNYQAVLDAHKACLLNPNNDKAQFRLIRGLLQIGRVEEASVWLDYFRTQQEKLPNNQLNSPPFLKVERDVQAALKSPRTSGATQRLQKTDNQTSIFFNQEKNWHENGTDYERRFVGHCNTTTDIKEVNFLGERGQFIMAGSDDGSFFIWDRDSTNLKKIIRGDSNIVNCLQPHPNTSLIATSGIDNHIRIWTPQPIKEEKNQTKNQKKTKTKNQQNNEQTEQTEQNEQNEQTEQNEQNEQNERVGVRNVGEGARSFLDTAVGTTVEDVGRATNDNQRRMHADPWSLVVGNWMEGNAQNPGAAPIVINPQQDCVQQ